MAPFAPEQVRVRTGSGGRQLSYIDASTAENRLDDVLGPEFWEFDVKPWGQDALIGTLRITLPNGRVISKSSVGAKAQMDADDDAAKSADSDAFKRCAARLGIGRYLRQRGLPGFVMMELGKTLAPSELAALACDNRSAPRHPQDSRPAQPPPGRPSQPSNNGGGRQFDNTRCPTSGRGLFAWAKEKENGGTQDVVRDLNRIGHDLGFADRMVDWTQDDVKGAWDAYHGTE